MGSRKPLWRAGKFEIAIVAALAVITTSEEYKALLLYGV
jgi:hypothetical protein